MKNAFLPSTERYNKAHRRKRIRHRIVTCLAAVVVFCTTYALILPAITLESDYICQQTEHQHGSDCYELVQSERLTVALTCEPEIHSHSPDCYDDTGQLICGLADRLLHTHDEYCYDDSGQLICTLSELTGHLHSEECLGDDGSLVCSLEQLAEHEHGAECYDEDGTLICGILSAEAHQHSDECRKTSTDCIEEYVLICTLEEHVHTDECLADGQETGEITAAALDVTEQIDSLPGLEELGSVLTAYEDSGYEDGYEAYFSEISDRTQAAYEAYLALTAEEQAQVSNADKLLELVSLWGVEALDTDSELTVCQINNYSQAKTTLVYGGSVREKLGSGMSFMYWDVIVVEKNSAGQLYVGQYVTADGSKLDYKANTSDGFVLLLYNTSTTVVTGDYVSVSFDYTNISGYNANGYGTVSFSSESSAGKAEKDNSEKLSIVKGADTNELIEVNLYDYGSNINELWSSNKNYPGFQQDKGQLAVSETYHSNFGNNITEDLAAGNSSVTNQGGDINKTDSDIAGAANAPISGAIDDRLVDGYPALADGTSLSYLFSDSAYAKKQNGNSINGLFLYHEDTGAYTFNSRENHAQFNAEDDTFTLYEQIISSNAFWYPFGNFLPFNDIVHESAQASTIDRDYLRSIVASAQTKYSSTGNSSYQNLASSLSTWIGKMDAVYPDGWGAGQAMNEYFNSKSGPGGKLSTDQAFDFSTQTDLLENLYSIDFDEETDFYFGMEMKMTFMQPKGGLTGNDGQQEMVFYFTGDDDVWVYIDGVLFIDLSGIHRHVGGEIDFVNGEVKYYALDISTGDVSTTPYKTVKFSDLVDEDLLNDKGTFKDYSTHTFNFYYMERGAGSGVCRMNFNFPLLKKNSISVTKELTVDDESMLPLLGDPDFRFQVLKEGGEALFIGQGVEYDILDVNGSSIGTGTTDENGVFTLKAGQTAVFSGIEENAGSYFVRELLDKDVFGQYGTVSVNGSSVTKNYDVTVGSESFTGLNSPVTDMSNGSTLFRFDNNVTTSKLGSLSITKTVTDYENARAVERFEIEVTLDGTPLPVGTNYTVGSETRTVAKEGIITLSPNETAVISSILAGTRFTVKETSASAEGYIVSYIVGDVTSTDMASGTIGIEANVAVTVNNRELGATVTIPLQKTLLEPDGVEHSYIFTLTQVTDSAGLTTVEGGTTRTLELNVTTEIVIGGFTLDYPLVELTELPCTFYYRIEELQAENTSTIYDRSVYVVEVTVSEDDSGLSACVSAIWKDCEKLTETDTVAFTNRIIRYELPATGGGGTHWYYTAGAALIAAAGLLYGMSRRRKGAQGSS